MTDDTPDCDTETDDESITKSTRVRWEYTGTILGSLTILSLIVLTVLLALGIASLEPVTQAWFSLYALIVLTAATWAFGKETIECAKKLTGK